MLPGWEFKFGAQFMKNVLFEKKKNYEINCILWNGVYTAYLKKAINFLVAYIYI